MFEALPDLIEQLPGFLGGHLQLSVAALVAALVVSLPLGVVAARNRSIATPALTVASVMQTIPALALLALMVPILGGTIGFAPAFAALTLYGVLPVLRNTIVGLQGVDPVVREAARGVGMSSTQSLIQVELPLAAPTIVAGIRTATVWIVGAATLATPVGAASLGNYIFSGLQTRTWAAVIFGCLCSAGLAILIDQLIRAIHEGLEARKLAQVLVAAAAAVLVPTTAIIGAGLYQPAASVATAGQAEGESIFEAPVVIGAKSFTEQYILADVLEARLQGAGADVRRLDNLGSTVVFDALVSGEIDVYVEYTGTVWASLMGRTDPAPRHVLNAAVTSWLYETHGLVVLGGLGFENAYGFAVSRQLAEQYDLQSIADLNRVDTLSVGADPEFFSRPEWDRVRAAYGLDQTRQRPMDSTFMYGAARDGVVDAVTAYTTDGRILAYDLVVLDDPAGALPPYDAILVLSAEAAGRPGLAEALQPLIGNIDADLMRRANAAVDVDRRPVREGAAVIGEALE
jgi:glycine betaine/choline ABC-type transport system substrate-binding protein/ABC-type nitrate/sulfonate/bicarbonate transport system permease component